MKIIRSITYLVVVFFSTIACTQKANDFAVISGTIKNNRTTDSLLLIRSGITKKIPINNDGSFRDTIRIERAENNRWHILRSLSGSRLFGDEWNTLLYLQNGYDLQIIAPESDSGAGLPVFLGSGSDINTYYIDKFKFKKQAPRVDDMIKLSEQEFKTRLNDIKDSYTAILNNAKIEDEDFIAFETKSIFWEDVWRYKVYAILKKRANKTYKPSPGFLPKAFLSFKADDEDLYLNNNTYSKISQVRYIERLNQIIDDTTERSAEEKIELINNSLNTVGIASLKEYLQTRFAFTFVGSATGDLAKKYLAYFTSVISDKDLVTNLTKFYKYGELLEPGYDSPKFVDYKNYDGGTSSLDDFKGKYLYIDFWAHWCVPCREELPYLKKVEKQFHDKNIVFIGISLDKPKDYEIWRNMVKKEELTGIQLIADNAFNSEFAIAYNIKSIPRFILIDPKGKIVDVKPPRPSNPKLVEFLEGLPGI